MERHFLQHVRNQDEINNILMYQNFDLYTAIARPKELNSAFIVENCFFRKECEVQMNRCSVTPEQLKQALNQVFCLLPISF